MTTTATKTRRPLAQALADAMAFRDLFPRQCWTRWEVAGSVRRRAAECGDVEHVVIPAFGELDVGDGLFTVRQRVNLLWFQLDALVRNGLVSKHLYGASGYRWGETNRGADFRGHNQEFFTADESNWGSKLAIATGPAEFSKKLVWELRLNGRRNHDGRVWQCRPCPGVDTGGDFAVCGEKCTRCQGTRLEPVSEIVVPEERDYFRVCGVQYAEPWERK